jgi:hypothetical protein
MHLIVCLLLAGLLVAADPGPQETVVVVNADSWASRTVASAWIGLRGIPDGNVVSLEGLPPGERIDLAAFRERILDRVESVLRHRGIAQRIAIVAYAPDLPIAITLPVGSQAPGRGGPGSLTALTLLAPFLHLGGESITAPSANPYGERPRIPGDEAERRANADPRSGKAMELWQAKDLAAAEVLLAQLGAEIPSPGVLYNLACARALLGRNDDAVTALRAAVVAGWLDASHSQNDPDLHNLRGLPVWPELIAGMAANVERITCPESPPFTPIPILPGQDGPPGRLAMLLAATSGRGLAVDAAISQLAASVAADGSRPQGTVWFMESDDEARTGPRRWAFASASRELLALGVDAKVVRGVLPPKDAPVIGAMVGSATFDLAGSGATILPGAWCDHLTSNGGELQPGGGQTPLTAWLRAGAAGSGGTVHEPYNIPMKFPSAFVHVHRVRGLSLVEAVHLTMTMPFQYLVVGDPLSRPWGARMGPVESWRGLPTARLTPASATVSWDGEVRLAAKTVGARRLSLKHLGREIAAADGPTCEFVVPARRLGLGAMRIILADGETPLSVASVNITAPGELKAHVPATDLVDSMPISSGEGWIEVAESGLHQVTWSSPALLAHAWNDARTVAGGGVAGGEPVVLAAGWHRLRLEFAPGSEPCEIRFGRHGTMPLTPARWKRARQ